LICCALHEAIHGAGYLREWRSLPQLKQLRTLLLIHSRRALLFHVRVLSALACSMWRLITGSKTIATALRCASLRYE